jgi:sugar phosphate isomerase/epimerase
MRYSYATVALPSLTPEQAISELASAGYQGVEWKVGEPAGRRPGTADYFIYQNRCTLPLTPDGDPRVRRLCRDAGLDIVGLAPYLAIGDIAGLRAAISMASAMGAAQVRVQAARWGQSPGEHYRQLAAATREYLAAAGDLARESRVRVVLEMHQNTVAPSASLAGELVGGLDPDFIGVIYDLGNLVLEGFEDPRIAFEVLGPYLHHVHLKNAAARRRPGGDRSRAAWEYVWSALDDGLVDVAGNLALLRSRGYSGWVSLEDLSRTRDPLATLRHNAAVLRALPHSAWPAP